MALFRKKAPDVPSEALAPPSHAAPPRPSTPVFPAGFADLGNSTFTLTESIRYTGLEDESLALLARLDLTMSDQYGRSFHSLAFDDHGTSVLPRHLTATGLDVSGTQIGFSAHISAKGYGLSGALDSGAVDMSVMTWVDEGLVEAREALINPASQLYFGDLGSQTYEMAEQTGKVTDVAWTPDGQWLAYAEWRGHALDHVASPGFIWRQNSSGQRFLVTVIDQFGGDETLSFSSDGAWILVSSGAGPVLVEAASGRWIRLHGIGSGSAWSPPHGPSALIGSRNTDDGVEVVVHDLQTGQTHVLGEVAALKGRARRYLTNFDVAPHGTKALCIAPIGVDDAHNDRHGARGRVCVLDLATLDLQMFVPAFLDASLGLERCHRRPRWLAARAQGITTVRPEVIEAMQAPLAPDGGSTEFLATEANDVLIHCVDALSPDRGVDDPARFRTEFVRSLVALRALAPTQYFQLQEPLMQFTTANFMQVLGSAPRQEAAAWKGIAFAEQLVREERFHEYDWSRHLFY